MNKKDSSRLLKLYVYLNPVSHYKKKGIKEKWFHEEPLSRRNLRCLRLSASSSPSIVDSVLTATAAPDLGSTIPPGMNFVAARPPDPPSSLVFPPALLTDPAVALTLLVVEETEFERVRNLRVKELGLVKKSLKALVVEGGGGGGADSNDDRRLWSGGEWDFWVARVVWGD